MFDFFRPTQVADVDKTVYAFFNFNEYTKVGEIAYFGCVLRTDSIFCIDAFPRIGFELFHAERHFAFFAVERQNNSFHFVADFQEILSTAEVLTPAHFRYVDKSFYAGNNFDKCAVVCHHNNFSFYFVAYFEVWV